MLKKRGEKSKIFHKCLRSSQGGPPSLTVSLTVRFTLSFLMTSLSGVLEVDTNNCGYSKVPLSGVLDIGEKILSIFKSAEL